VAIQIKSGFKKDWLVIRSFLQKKLPPTTEGEG